MSDPLDRLANKEPAVSINPHQLDREIVQSLLEMPQQDKVFNPLEDGPHATARLQDRRQKWSEDGSTVVFTSGVFDLMHVNHRAYLLQTKLEAMPIHFNRYWAEHIGKNWQDLDAEAQKAYCQQALQDNSLRLIVSIDGDEAVAFRKGRDPKKQTSRRPIYSWQTRARDVLSIAAGSAENQLHSVVDAVTIHDNQVEALRGSDHEDIMSIAECVQPDVWSIYDESTDIIGKLEAENGGGKFPQTQAVVLGVHDYYTDERLGGGFSTTAIVRSLGASAAREVAVK